MKYKTMIVLLVIVLVAALLALPSMAGAANGKGMAPPGLHKAPAATHVNPHVVCIRCHTSPTFSGCMGAGCH